jgi:hypothetical protein
MNGHYFAVIHLTKKKILTFSILLLIVFIIIGVIISFSLRGEREGGYLNIEFEKVIQNNQSDIVVDSFFPRFFIAGGVNYDNSILEKHNIPGITSNYINHFEKVGIYTILAEVKKIRYYPENNKVEVLLEESSEGYNLVQFNKSVLNEGVIIYEFIDGKGQRLSVEEDYIYSIPVDFTILDEGDSYSTISVLDRFVIVDNEVKPILSEAGYDVQILDGINKEEKLSLYILGGYVETVQKQGDNIRIYFNESEGYQLITIDTGDFKQGVNRIKFIRERDLKEIETLNFWKN